jgi:hypothetical protein
MPRVEALADRDRGVDDSHVRVGLGEIAEQAPGDRLDVLGEQPERVRLGLQPVEERDGAIDLAHHRERFDDSPSRMRGAKSRISKRPVAVSTSVRRTLVLVTYAALAVKVIDALEGP